MAIPETPRGGSRFPVVGEPRPAGTAPRERPQEAVELWRVEGAEAACVRDAVAVEEPLEIRLAAGGEERTAALTMRTPGDDAELAAGFLWAEGLIRRREDLVRVTHAEGDASAGNVVVAELAAPALPDLAALERHFFATSACGVCGRAGLEALALRGVPAPAAGPAISARVIASLPGALREAQGVFEATGGLHAAALFDPAGRLLAVREDVGRHNALDKVVGWALAEGRLPLSDAVLMVSGRASFEILQKALAAGVPAVCAVSAPSSLAVELARRFGITLIGFLRGDRFNVYSGAERVEDLASRV